MSDAELSYAGQLDVACILFHNKDILSLLVNDPGQLGGFIIPKNNPQAIDFVRRLGLFQHCNGVVRTASSPEIGPFALCDDFREVLIEALGGRDIDSFTNTDAQVVASRHADWIELPMDRAWSDALALAR
jgi:hypothetical protein